MGHLSFSVLEKYLGYSNSLHSISDSFICFQAKHSDLVLLLVILFLHIYLIYCDVWGPY